jgi:hypothetical protein
MGEFKVGKASFGKEISCPICEGKKCSVCDIGPSLDDIILCTHYDLKGKKYRKRICECVEGEIGWTNKSGKLQYLGEKTIKTSEKTFTKKIFRQLKIVHTTRWENKYNLKKRFGNRARSSLRISKNVLDILNLQTGPSGRSTRKEFAQGLPACGNTHRIRRQIFLLFHTDSEYLLRLLQSYSFNPEYRKKIDSIRGKEKHNVVAHLPVLERATDDLIDKILWKKEATKSTIAETKLEFLKYPLLKEKSKWRWNLCRLVELRFIHKKFKLEFPQDVDTEAISDIYDTPELEKIYADKSIRYRSRNETIEIPYRDKISGEWKIKKMDVGINIKSLDEFGDIEEEEEP